MLPGGDPARHCVRARAVPVRGGRVRHGARPGDVLRGQRAAHLGRVRRAYLQPPEPAVPAQLLRQQVLHLREHADDAQPALAAHPPPERRRLRRRRRRRRAAKAALQAEESLANATRGIFHKN